MTEARYPVVGMTCDGCVQGVTRALKRKAPDLEFTVTLEPGEIVVRGEHDPETVRAAVEAAGFDNGPSASA